MFKIFRKVYYASRAEYLKIILKTDSPHKVGLGLAIGIFVGLTPTWPLQTFIALAFAFILRGNKIIAALGVWISNPLTIPIMYPFLYYIGLFVSPFSNSGSMPVNWGLKDLIMAGSNVALTALIGGLCLSVIFAPITYVIAYFYLKRLQSWQKHRLEYSG